MEYRLFLPVQTVIGRKGLLFNNCFSSLTFTLRICHSLRALSSSSRLEREPLICHLWCVRFRSPVLIVWALLLTGCYSAQDRSSGQKPVRGEARYPAHWWTPAPTNGAPGWEILPQAAGPGEVILSKRNELGLLSNFAPTPFTFRGKHYASLEGFWQMMKYPEDTNDLRATFPGLEWKLTREQVGQLTAFDAKHAGSAADANMKKMGITWVTFEGKRL